MYHVYTVKYDLVAESTNHTDSSYHTGTKFSPCIPLFACRPKTNIQYETNKVGETSGCEDKKLPLHPPKRFSF